MEDLNYIVKLGFSGADVVRAVGIAFFVAMLARRSPSVWFLGAIALVIDRIIWPVLAMGLSGADIHSIYASIGALGETFKDDLGLYVVRYVGLTIMIAAFTAGRSLIHQRLGATAAA